jgi:hypothetical protein
MLAYGVHIAIQGVEEHVLGAQGNRISRCGAYCCIMEARYV